MCMYAFYFYWGDHGLPVSVYEGIEGESISPTGSEILDVDLRVPGARINLL